MSLGYDGAENGWGRLSWASWGGAGCVGGGWQESYGYTAGGRMTRKRLTVGHTQGTAADVEYRYPATQNDGRITQRKDWISGEEVVYQYDALQRLISAETVGPEWGQSFAYDGFGNLLSQTVTKGSAPSLSVTVNGATNRITTAGYGYDANGNLTAMPMLTLGYDVENRLVEATHSVNGTDRYVYDAANRRVWKGGGEPEDGVTYFYGAAGEKLGEYTYGHQFPFQTRNRSVWFAGKLLSSEGEGVVVDWTAPQK